MSPSLPSPDPAATSATGRRAGLLAVLTIVLAVSAAYVTSFQGALVFDDIPGIARNPTIRNPRLDLLMVAIGPQGGTLSGRPVPNLTLALNHAISADRLWSYHAGNLLIHVLAGLALFGLVRRTLLRPPLAAQFGASALPLALAIAGLWSLHPLQTESVTYLVQRVESLMGLCYLLTLYCFVRSVDSPRPRAWQAAAFLSCLTGMGCKEVMVSAPLVVLLYDRTFVAGSWSESWRRRRWLHTALFSTWLVLGALILATENRAGTAGLGTPVAWWEYSFTQCQAIVHYLGLAVWPRPLVFDYGTTVVRSLWPVAPQAALLVLLLAGTGWALVRRPALGFLGAWFFLILAPSSSVVPVATQTMAEHRMYLPLAAVVTLAVLAVHRWFGRAALPVWLAVGVAFAAVTALRNLDYRSPQGLWADVAQKLPENGRAHNNLGAYLLIDGRFAEARARFDEALRLDPRHASAHYNLGNLLSKTGRKNEAIAAYEEALRLDPGLADAQVNLGNALDELGRPAEAVPHYEAALRLDPGAPDANTDLGADLLRLGQVPAAIDHLQAALDAEPARAETWNDLAAARQEQGDVAAARAAAGQALRLKPDLPAAHYTLGNIEAGGGNYPAAIDHYRRALALAPDYIAARNNLANALLVSGRVDEAVTEYRQILRQTPDDRSVQENLARALELQH